MATANQRNALCALPAAPRRLVAGYGSLADRLRLARTCRAAPAADLDLGDISLLGGELVWQRPDGLRFEGRRDGENSIFCRLARYSKPEEKKRNPYSWCKRLDTEPFAIETLEVCEGLRALALVENNTLVEIGQGATAAAALKSSAELEHDGRRNGVALPETGWSVANWSLVRGGRLARPGYVKPDWLLEEIARYPSLAARIDTTGHALLAGGNYTDAFVCYYECERPPKVVLTMRKGQKGFGVLLSSWHDQRDIDGNDGDFIDSGSHYHYESANLRLDGLTDGWHHFAVTADASSLSYYVDGSLRRTFAISKPTGRPRERHEEVEYYQDRESWTDTYQPPVDYNRLVEPTNKWPNFTAKDWGVQRMDAIGNTPPISDGGGGENPWGCIADFRLFGRKLTETEISLIMKPVRAKMDPAATS